MQTFKQQFTIAAGATNNNLVAGDILQFLPWPAKIKFWLTQTATGLQARITVGTQVVGGSGQAIRPNINAAGDIDTLRDGIGEAVGDKGDQVIVSVTNPTGAPLLVTALVTAEPIV